MNHTAWNRIRVAVLAAAALAPASAQIKISNGEGQSLRLGFQGQFWADWQQDQNTTGNQGYQQNLYLRRVRFIAAGQLADDVSFFFETDQPNLGKYPKSTNSGFLVQDAFLEYKAKNALRLDGGLMIVPLTRNGIQSTASYYTLDFSPIAAVSNSSTQSSALRDLGLQARGFFLKDHLLYRLGMFAGKRDTNNRNSLRSAGYIQYDFLDPETGYVLTGTALGKQKILAVNAGFDRQGSYGAYSANLAAAIPVRGGDEIGGQYQYVYYNGKTQFTNIPEQNDHLVEMAYYIRKAKVQPFWKYEGQHFVPKANSVNSYNRWGGGLNYYVHGQTLKFTAQAQRAIPNLPIKPANEFSFQLQLFYF